MWDQRYSETGFAYGKSPNDFIREKARGLKPESSIVCLASGEGRNAVYLATLGHRVTAVDLSVVGLEKTRQLASEHGVDVETIQADLATFDPGVEIWDGATSVFAHVLPSVRGALHGRIVRALKPGGILLLEAYSPRHIEMPGRGGPPPRAQEMFMRTEELKAELEGLDFETIQEVDREIQEGIYHEGLSAVVQVVARKPA